MLEMTTTQIHMTPSLQIAEDFDMAVLLEAQRMVKDNVIPRLTWSTWDVFAGRSVDHEEPTDRWMLRILREARQRCAKN